MNQVTLYRTVMWIGFIASCMVLFIKISHYPMGAPFMAISFICSLFLIIIGLTDVFVNDRIKQNERLMWFLGFLFMTPLVSLVYFPIFKKRNQM